MSGKAPWRPIAIVAGLLAMLFVAFRFPIGGESPSASSEQAANGDGAVIKQAASGVAETPEPQPGIELPQPQPGEKPIQTVVISVDGGCETADNTISNLMNVGSQVNGRFTFFVSGLCLLPESKKNLYQPPGHSQGSSDIGFASGELTAKRIATFTDMYRAGHEVGTHFLGHFCGSSGVGNWSAADWTSEINQSNDFLDNWAKNNPQAATAGPLPFNSSVIVGDRTPCLEGNRDAMWKAYTEAGFRYDASNSGTLVWPQKVANGRLWEFPLPALKLSGTNLQVLAMDYNFLANQTNAQTQVPQATCDQVEEQTYRSYMDALDAVYNGNRAPLSIGSHLNDWVCGAYITSLERFITDAHAKYPDVRFVSFKDLADWLDVMDPDELAKLQALPVQTY